MDTFYNADVAIVDMSLLFQQRAIIYHLGIRESFGMKENIVMENDTHQEATLRLKISCGNYTFLPYRLSSENNSCIITNPNKEGEDSTGESKQFTLIQRLKKILLDVEIQSKAHMKEKFLNDLRAAREQYAGDVDEMKKVLHNMRKRLDDPNVLSGEVFQSFMYSLRDVQVSFYKNHKTESLLKNKHFILGLRWNGATCN